MTTTPPISSEPIAAAGAFYRVETLTTMLRVRSAPRIPSSRPTSNIIAELPDGHSVRGVTDTPENGFLLIETRLSGALIRGYSSTKYLVRTADAPVEPKVAAAPNWPQAHMPASTLKVTRASTGTWARSLNEPNMPRRTDGPPAAVRKALSDITDWLGVDRTTHLRWKPGGGRTFCNVYAHDFCSLAWVYLPRVWWSSKALVDIAAGKPVTPRYGATVEEIVANRLYSWFNEFGPDFGWRRVASPTELQLEANNGAVGVIIARRVNNVGSGHIVIVLPEDGVHAAIRDASGSVVRPLQSQAGAVNFRRGTGTGQWWKDSKFAEFAYWIHA